MWRTEGEREVKGAATDASPGRTMGMPCSSAAFSEAAAMSPPFLASYTLPWMAARRVRSTSSSRCIRPNVDFIMPIVFIAPISSPAAVRRSISSRIQTCCSACSSFCFFFSATCCSFADAA